MNLSPEENDRVLKSRILIVDDRPTNCVLLEAILGGAKYDNVQSVTDPRLVNDLHLKWRFDLILLDIRMPHMSGFEVMEQLQAITGDDYLPILVLTAQTDAETRNKALDLGAKDFVTKPFERVEVLRRIRNILEVRHMFAKRGWEKAAVEAEVRKRTLELADTQLAFIRQLGRAGEYRDNETGMHVVRMSKNCQLLSLALGNSEGDAELILHSSPMHDVGKIGIPDHILLKPGKFEPDEWEIMKSHVEIGAEILSIHPAQIIQMAHTIVMTHHEKWDGSGYPAGLKGEKIPAAGRIAAIADVFDALTSERPYKKPWAVADAIQFVKDQAGSHFDPHMVSKFIEIMPAVLDVREQHSDEGIVLPNPHFQKMVSSAA